jgi:hypothetical protein
MFDDLCNHAPFALEQVRQSLPQDFPASIADAIANGINSRLRVLAEA